MSYELTGKTRYRVVRYGFGKEVVAVEVEAFVPEGPVDHNGMPSTLGGYMWKLASATDMLRLQKE